MTVSDCSNCGRQAVPFSGYLRKAEINGDVVCPRCYDAIRTDSVKNSKKGD